MPAGGVFSGTAVSGITFSPAVAGIGTHDITYTYTLGNCTKSTIASTTIKFDSATIHYNTEIKIINNNNNVNNLNANFNVKTDKVKDFFGTP